MIKVLMRILLTLAQNVNIIVTVKFCLLLSLITHKDHVQIKVSFI